MSKINKTVFLVLFGLITATSPAVFAQTGSLSINVSFEDPHWKIAGEYTKPLDSTISDLKFVDDYADAGFLSKRISEIRAFGRKGEIVGLSQAGEGVYRASAEYSRFEYTIDLTSPSPLIAAPHVSWASKDIGLLKLGDLLPELRGESVRIAFELPVGWSLFTSEKRNEDSTFEVVDVQNAVFVAGKGVRPLSRSIGGARFSFAIAGEWQFADSALTDMTNEILAEYLKIFGSFPARRFQVNLLPFPGEIENDRWRAQTQSGTITIVSSPSTYRNLAPQRLHEQLRHELFHIWLPEGVKLEGDYSWFYEGFARYQSLKTGVWVGRIRFEDFLNSMSEAINISSMDETGQPLSELSKSIWKTGPGVVAAKGMSVAFLCDLRLLAGSGGRRNVADILKSLYGKHRGGAPVNGSISVEAELNQHSELSGVVEEHINGIEPIKWASSLRPFGLFGETRNGRTVLSAESRPKGEAKALLNKLGYTRWKKYSPGLR